ncbi:MAG: hypothetical protein K1X28_04495 [Parachlamydiales bacterium]|nr:hypothetical protein [Parachlamydiales bacterium]
MKFEIVEQFAFGYTESGSRIGRWQGDALNLSQAKPMPKQPMFKNMGDAGGSQIQRLSTLPEPILESRAV